MRLDGIPQEIHHVVCFLDDIFPITTQPWNATWKWCGEVVSKLWEENIV